MEESVLAYLPQQPPFVMIDELVQADETRILSRFTIREGHLLVEDGCFTEAGLVENMAQTAAAGTGLQAQRNGTPPPVGYIGALKGLKVQELPRIGETITTEIIFVHQVLNAHIVQGSTKCGARELASCELKIFLPS